jgi:hypothetical protein
MSKPSFNEMKSRTLIVDSYPSSNTCNIFRGDFNYPLNSSLLNLTLFNTNNIINEGSTNLSNTTSNITNNSSEKLKADNRWRIPPVHKTDSIEKKGLLLAETATSSSSFSKLDRTLKNLLLDVNVNSNSNNNKEAVNKKLHKLTKPSPTGPEKTQLQLKKDPFNITIADMRIKTTNSTTTPTENSNDKKTKKTIPSCKSIKKKHQNIFMKSKNLDRAYDDDNITKKFPKLSTESSHLLTNENEMTKSMCLTKNNNENVFSSIENNNNNNINNSRLIYFKQKQRNQIKFLPFIKNYIKDRRTTQTIKYDSKHDSNQNDSQLFEQQFEENYTDRPADLDTLTLSSNNKSKSVIKKNKMTQISFKHNEIFNNDNHQLQSNSHRTVSLKNAVNSSIILQSNTKIVNNLPKPIPEDSLITKSLSSTSTIDGISARNNKSKISLDDNKLRQLKYRYSKSKAFIEISNQNLVLEGKIIELCILFLAELSSSLIVNL